MRDRIYIISEDDCNFLAKMFNHDLTKYAGQSTDDPNLWWIVRDLNNPNNGVQRRVTEQEAIDYLLSEGESENQ